MTLKTVVFKDIELMKEGVTKDGKPWQKYQYYGDDGEHYMLFGKLELEKPYQLAQKQREFNGKTYTDWFVVPQGGGKGGGGSGVKAILDRMEGLAADIQDIKKAVTMLVESSDKKDEAELPF